MSVDKIKKDEIQYAGVTKFHLFECYKFSVIYGLLRKMRSRNPTSIRKSTYSFVVCLFSSCMFGLQGHENFYASMKFS